jgi:hypothetical protein
MVEKTARTRRLPAITVDVAEPFVRPELDALDVAAGPHRAPLGPELHTGPHVESAPRLPWSEEARERVERIPAGFVRNLAVEQIERLALALHAAEVTLLHADAGIAEARARMQREQPAVTGSGGCPVHANGGTTAEQSRAGDARLNEVTAPVVDALGRRHTD